MAKVSIPVMGLIAIFAFGCSSTNCRRYNNLSEATKTEWVGDVQEETGENNRIKIYKPDGSLQCGMGQAIAPEVMREELEGVEVYSSEKASDGMMHIQACGTPTGQINVFEIRQVDLDIASKKGFKVFHQ